MVPLLVHLVGELVDQIGVEVGDQRRHLVGDQANPALAGAQCLGVKVALGDIGEGVDEATVAKRLATSGSLSATLAALLSAAIASGGVPFGT